MFRHSTEVNVQSWPQHYLCCLVGCIMCDWNYPRFIYLFSWPKDCLFIYVKKFIYDFIYQHHVFCVFYPRSSRIGCSYILIFAINSIRIRLREFTLYPGCVFIWHRSNSFSCLHFEMSFVLWIGCLHFSANIR